MEYIEPTIEELSQLPEMTGNFVEDSSDLSKILLDESREIFRLGSAFAATGNSHMEREMKILGHLLKNAAKRVTDIYSKRIGDDLKQSEESTGLLVGTLMKGLLEGVIDPSRRKPIDENVLAEEPTQS